MVRAEHGGGAPRDPALDFWLSHNDPRIDHAADSRPSLHLAKPLQGPFSAGFLAASGHDDSYKELRPTSAAETLRRVAPRMLSRRLPGLSTIPPPSSSPWQAAPSRCA